MNILNLTNDTPLEEIEQLQMDLEAPLLGKNNNSYTADDSCVMSFHIADNSSNNSNQVVSKRKKSIAKNKKKPKQLMIHVNEDEDLDQSSQTTECQVLNCSFYGGLALGIILQALSYYVNVFVMPMLQANDASGAGSGAQDALRIPLILGLGFLARYWVIIIFFLSPLVMAMCKKLKHARRRSTVSKQKGVGARKSIHSNLEAILDFFRFQCGLIFGSLMLLSLLNFYDLVLTAPLLVVAIYYGICVGLSFFIICFLRLFSEQVCSSVSSVEVTISYDHDSDDEESGL
ncbi:unnamed protein product [Pseudo-nitzschia multistriata]|uniref:Transmembrane protein n=1 Tax=Pseudo-nitzschia multistriata TaxID=183589 RepID=A0A448Z874_9STRA|nr:unnamed protein product [Pseudo-nitzschia multistriata]